MKSTLYVFLPDGVFLPCDHELNFEISLYVSIQSINQIKCKVRPSVPTLTVVQLLLIGNTGVFVGWHTAGAANY